MVKKQQNRLLLIIPAYNEQAVIKKTVEKAARHGFDYVVINDGSTDKTEKILRDNRFNHITLPKNMGIGRAVQEGYRYAKKNRYDIAVQFDADGQHDIRYVEKLVQPILLGEADFAIGSRFINRDSENFQSSFARRAGIRVISRYIKLLSGRKIYDTTSGFRAANKKIIEKFAKSYPRRYPEPSSTFELLREGFNVVEIPARMFERGGGKSSINATKSIGYMVSVISDITKVYFSSRKLK